jgi:hypothetical protein
VRQVTECRKLDGSTPKPAQQWGPWKLLDQIKGWVKAGIKIYSCYEAGVCGYWYHRELIKAGAVNFVVCPGSWRTNALSLILNRQFPAFQRFLKFRRADRLAEIVIHSSSKALFPLTLHGISSHGNYVNR